MNDKLKKILLSNVDFKDVLFIVLAGSYNTKEFSKKSDYDLFVITNFTNKVKILNNKEKHKIEIFYYSTQRLKHCIKINDHIIVDVLARGKIIYSKNKKITKKIINSMKNLYLNYKMNKDIQNRMIYRFNMIKDKLSVLKSKNDLEIRWLIIFSLPYVIRVLFYINRRVCPSTKQWLSESLKLQISPNNFKDNLLYFIGSKKTDTSNLKLKMLETIKFIEGEIGTLPDSLEIKLSSKDPTTLI